jgi:hypothetical protein
MRESRGSARARYRRTPAGDGARQAAAALGAAPSGGTRRTKGQEAPTTVAAVLAQGQEAAVPRPLGQRAAAALVQGREGLCAAQRRGGGAAHANRRRRAPLGKERRLLGSPP